MKFASVQPLALVALLALYILLSLLGSVAAHEDPSEAARRRQLSNLYWFRDRYRSSYMFMDRYPQPPRPELLGEYPRSITTIANDLKYFGTSQWRPSDNIVSMLNRLDGSTKALLLNSLHPNLIESQPETLRNKHYDTFRGIVEWLHENFDEIARLEGAPQTELRLRRYKAIRDLAGVGTMIPRF